MKIPKGIDAVDILYAICFFSTGQSFKKQGLTKDQLKRSLKALDWFLKELTHTFKVRRKWVAPAKRRGHK